MYNFTELVSNVATILQRSGDTAYASNIKVWINLGQDYLYNIYDYWQELQEVHNFNTADATENYYMPNNFDKPLRIYDLTNKRHITVETEETYFDRNIANIANSTKGKPSVARIFGTTGIALDIASAGTTFKVKSSDSEDSGGIVVRIEGYVDSGKNILDFENITVSTSSPTTFVAGTKTFYKVTHISKSADTTGYITVANSSETTVAILASIERVIKHKVMKLGLIPDATYSMRVLFKKRYNKLVNNNDYPFVEADDFLILNACAYGLAQEKETYDKATTMWNKSQECLNALLRNQQAKLGPDFQHMIVPAFSQAHRV